MPRQRPDLSWLSIVSLFICFTLCAGTVAPDSHDEINLKQLREEVRAMFKFAWNSYKRFAFPADEIRPISCSRADPFGGYSTTVMGMNAEFEEHVQWLGEHLSFDTDRNVSVFETNIRMMGGLLSAHLFATDSPAAFKSYDGSLLVLAEDLALRMLPAFDTPTGIPYGTVNLRHGVPFNESQFTCLAGAGTFSLEFGLLSRLTGKPLYEQLARTAVDAMWSRRTSLQLVGTHINIMTGEWSQREANIGAGADSFYEYLLKAALLFGNGHYMEMFRDSYTALLKYARHHTGWYLSVHIDTGTPTSAVFDSLQGFWPALQVLYGDVESAAHTLNTFMTQVHRHGVPPELVSLSNGNLVRPGYPLRPELIESLYYMSQVTDDPHWLRFGRDMVRGLQLRTRTQCGFATVKSVETGELEDQMDSYFLAETLKYLFLLFDRGNFITRGNYIFNTEVPSITTKMKLTADEGHPYRMDTSFWEWANALPIQYGEMKFNDTASTPPTLLFQLAYDEFQPLPLATSVAGRVAPEPLRNTATSYARGPSTSITFFPICPRRTAEGMAQGRTAASGR